MITRFRFDRLALDANERRTHVRDPEVLPIPTLDERVTLYLRAVHGNRDFTEEERSNARNVLLNSMAAEIAGQVIPADQSLKGEHPAHESRHGADWGSFLAQYSLPEESAQRQEWTTEPDVAGPLPPHQYEAAPHYWQGVQRTEAIKVAPIARRRTSIVALTATFGLALIVTGGTLGYRWTRPQMTDEVTTPTHEAREAPATTSPPTHEAHEARVSPPPTSHPTQEAQEARVSPPPASPPTQDTGYPRA